MRWLRVTCVLALTTTSCSSDDEVGAGSSPDASAAGSGASGGSSAGGGGGADTTGGSGGSTGGSAGTEGGGSSGAGGTGGMGGSGGTGGASGASGSDAGPADASIDASMSDRDGAADATAVDAGLCDDPLSHTAPVATCSVFAAEPSASGGTIVDGVYHLVSWETAVCSAQSQTIAIWEVSTDVYEGLSVTDAGSGEVRSAVRLTASGTTLTIHQLCNGDADRDVYFTAENVASVDTLTMVWATQTFTYERVGSLADAGL